MNATGVQGGRGRGQAATANPAGPRTPTELIATSSNLRRRRGLRIADLPFLGGSCVTPAGALVCGATGQPAKARRHYSGSQSDLNHVRGLTPPRPARTRLTQTIQTAANRSRLTRRLRTEHQSAAFFLVPVGNTMTFERARRRRAASGHSARTDKLAGRSGSLTTETSQDASRARFIGSEPPSLPTTA